MGITKSKGHKELNDKFYTNPDIAKKCLDLLDLSSFDIVIEPSAGNGSFSNQIENCRAYDLVPENTNIIRQDFFDLDIDDLIGKNVLTVGNPPFGVQNNLAVRFFNKAAEYSKTIAFILPKSFLKDSIQDKLDLRFHLEKCMELPKNSFLLNGEPYDVPCVFQIWKKQDNKRVLLKNKDFNPYIKFVNDNDFDFAIWRVGGKSGLAYLPENKNEVSRQSNYLVKNTSLYSNETLINKINEINKTCTEYSVGPKSISKKELTEYMIKNIIYEARQQSGFDFEKIVERLFKNVYRNKSGYTNEFDGHLKYNGLYVPCQMKHTTSNNKSFIELADLNRNASKEKDYILFNGIDSSSEKEKIKIHYKDKIISVDNTLGILTCDIFVYHIYPEDLKINIDFLNVLKSLTVENRYTKLMDIDKGICDFKDASIFKHGMNTSIKTIMKILVKKDILGKYDFFDRMYLNDKNGFVVYEPKDGFITHIPVDDNGNVYLSVDDVPMYYNAVLKVDHTNLTDDNWAIVNQFMVDGFSKNNDIVKIHPKRDHKNQYRIQCSVETKCIENNLCEYDENLFSLNKQLKNILSYDNYLKEPSLWE